MAKASINPLSPACGDRNTLPSQPIATDASVERWMSRWLAQLLEHFSVQQLDKISTQEIAAYLAGCLDDSPDNTSTADLKMSDSRISDFNIGKAHLSQSVALSPLLQAHPGEHSTGEHLSRHYLAAELKRRVMRLAGAKLDNAFLSMASKVVDEATVEVVSLPVEGRSLQGVRYQGDVYRQVDSFKLCHQLQAYCLAQTLSEQQVQYLITRSAHRFVVWAKIRTFPQQKSRVIS